MKTNTNSYVRYVDLKSFDFNCGTPVKIMDVNENGSGNVHQQFVDYNYDINLTLIKKMAELLGPITGIVPDSFIESTANYPETTECNPMK